MLARKLLDAVSRSRSTARIPGFALLKWSANHADPVLFSAVSMWYSDTPRAGLAQVGNVSTWAKEAENRNILWVIAPDRQPAQVGIGDQPDLLAGQP